MFLFSYRFHLKSYISTVMPLVEWNEHEVFEWFSHLRYLVINKSNIANVHLS